MSAKKKTATPQADEGTPQEAARAMTYLLAKLLWGLLWLTTWRRCPFCAGKLKRTTDLHDGAQYDECLRCGELLHVEREKPDA